MNAYPEIQRRVWGFELQIWASPVWTWPLKGWHLWRACFSNVCPWEGRWCSTLRICSGSGICKTTNSGIYYSESHLKLRAMPSSCPDIPHTGKERLGVGDTGSTRERRIPHLKGYACGDSFIYRFMISLQWWPPPDSWGMCVCVCVFYCYEKIIQEMETFKQIYDLPY